MGNFYIEIIRKDSRFGSLKPIHDLALLEPITRGLVLAIIADADAAGIKLMAYETFLCAAILIPHCICRGRSSSSAK